MAPRKSDKSGASPSAPELKKLTVPQLKALCKEKGLTGYSKLTKDVIILKLSPFYPAHGHTAPSERTSQGGSSCHDPSTALENSARNTSNVNIGSTTAHDLGRLASSGGRQAEPHIATPISSSGKENRSLTPASGRTPGTGRVVEPGIQDISRHKRALPKDAANENAKKKLPRVLEVNRPPAKLQNEPTFKLPALPSRVLTHAVQAASSLVHASRIVEDAVEPTSTKKRFKPLVGAKDTIGSKSISKETNIAMPNAAENQLETWSVLDFPVESEVVLRRITLPPSIAGRKQAQNFAIILSGISRMELQNCSLASKTLRYSAYLSAFHRLRRDFPGKRTEYVLSQNNCNMTDAWPYLLQRQQEVSIRKGTYEKSFLSQTVGDWYLLSERLWTSANHPKQAVIAIRFVMTRFYFLISVQGMDHPDARRQHIVVDCNEVVKDEIWTVAVCSQGMREEYHVLEPTCEVIGCQVRQSYGLQPRVDWSSYISQRVSEDAGISLFERLKWTNQEEYKQGISKHWLNRIRDEGQVGEAKAKVARKYILACVVANGISGKWMSSIEMAQEFAGLPSNGLERRKAREDVQLYVPEHHYVESVHFTSAKGLSLHEALAIVQTPGREYFILRDNAMQVGCEEEGVGSVWKSILRCRSDGVHM